ncbi:hypothetical protein SNN58_004594 [Cronobacter dublinensis]|nr:hypothetical protein [Cronobacter dublinensis]ELY3973305.1 hypothetical protein [Cronobacter dublinensis]ELY4484589.1 hypothetical protein [Cronobacter dublinensis]ELY5825971.1 hypothetical protein [Cronobacter dublinensis]
MKYKSAIVLCLALALSGCNKNDINCDDNSVQGDLQNRLFSALALESGSGESTAQFKEHISIMLTDHTQNEDKTTERAAQCTAKLTVTDAHESGKSLIGTINYDLFKGTDDKVHLDADSVRTGLNLSKFKVIKIDETAEQKHWRESQEQQKAEQLRQEKDKQAAEEAKTAEFQRQITAAKSLADDEFKPITDDSLMLLFLANSGRKVTDDEKLGLLSDRWNAEKDPFKRNDMKQEELIKVNNRLSSFEGIKYIKVSKILPRLNNRQEAIKKEVITDAYLGISKPEAYDFEKKYFPIDVAGCGNSISYGPQDIYRTQQNVKLTLEKSAIKCYISPKSEEEARRISSILSNIPGNIFSAEGTAYLMVNGYDAPKVTINTTLIREDISIYKNQVDALNDKAPSINITLN